jgi:hypothetical protein
MDPSRNQPINVLFSTYALPETAVRPTIATPLTETDQLPPVRLIRQNNFAPTRRNPIQARLIHQFFQAR